MGLRLRRGLAVLVLKQTLRPLHSTAGRGQTSGCVSGPGVLGAVLKCRLTDDAAIAHGDGEGHGSFCYVPLLLPDHNAFAANHRRSSTLSGHRNVKPQLQCGVQRYGRRRLEQHSRGADIIRCSLRPFPAAQLTKIDWDMNGVAFCPGAVRRKGFVCHKNRCLAARQNWLRKSRAGDKPSIAKCTLVPAGV